MARRASRINLDSSPPLGRGTGFTIVELLIVIVVVAILAAITIVAYNGIQNRAKASAAQAAAKQALGKIQTFAVTNADSYPSDLAAAELTNSENTSYQYRVNNSTSPKNFCLTTTSNGVSYYVSNVISSPTPGACDGHGVNGAPTVTNLVTNPGLNVDATGCASFNGAGTIAYVSNAGVGGTGACRLTYTITANQYYQGVGIGRTSISDIPVSPGTTVLPSVYVGSNVSKSVRMVVSYWNASNAVVAGTELSDVSSIALTANAPLVRLSAPAELIVPATAVRMTIRVSPGAGVTFVAGDTLLVDNVMVTEGSTLRAYADGYTPSWVWNGTPNNSTSTGPPL